MRSVLVKWSPVWTIGLILLGIGGAYLGSSVKLKLSLTDLLPSSHPAVQEFEELTETVGGVGYLAIILESPDEKSHLELAPKLKTRLEQEPDIKTAFYRRERRFFVDRMLYYMSIGELKELRKNITTQIRSARAKVIDLGLWDAEPKQEKPKEAFNSDLKKLAKESADISPYLTSADNKHLLMMVKPNFDSTDLEKSKDLVDRLDKILPEFLPANIKYSFAERYYKKVIETQIIERDIFVLGIVAVASILLSLFIYLRSFAALVIIFLPIAVSLGITMGLTKIFIGHINIITAFLIGILSGLGVDYGIHMFLRLPLERREPSGDDPDPIWRALASSGHAVFIGAIAAAFAFYLLTFSDFKAFSEFGFVCGTGILTVFICLMTMYSCLARLFKLDQGPVPKPGFGGIKLPMLSLPKGLIGGAIITAAFLVGALFVHFEYDFDRMMRHSMDLENRQNLVDEIYQRSVTPSALKVPTKAVAVGIENMLKEKYIPDTVSDLISGATIVPENQQEKKAILRDIQYQLSRIKDRWIKKSLGVPASAAKTWVKADPFTVEDLPVHLQDFLFGKTKSGYLMYIYPAIPMSTAKNVRIFANMIRDVDSQFPEMISGSDAVIFSDILDLITHDGSRVIIAILIFVGLFMWINLRRIDDTLFSYLPLLIAFPVGMGLMALLGIRFNIFNIAIIPAFVAIGIDIPLHITHRAREVRSGYKAAWDLTASANLALVTTGLGFGALVFAKTALLRSLGWVAVLGTVAIWWVALFMLPAALELYYRRQSKKADQKNPPVNR